jgi:hypothetical protein
MHVEQSYATVVRDEGALELEAPQGRYVAPPPDRRPLMPEPPPVRLVAVEDVQAKAPAGAETALDDFYVTMLQLERENSLSSSQDSADEIVYKAENVRLRLVVREPPLAHADMRPIGVEVRSLALTEAKIVERELEYERLKALVAGQDTLMLRDPAGNWIAIIESREMR